jgi:hypothetical protein
MAFSGRGEGERLGRAPAKKTLNSQCEIANSQGWYRAERALALRSIASNEAKRSVLCTDPTLLRRAVTESIIVSARRSQVRVLMDGSEPKRKAIGKSSGPIHPREAWEDC